MQTALGPSLRLKSRKWLAPALGALITFRNPLHHLHAPVHEFFRGERVPCFEKPARADYVESRLTERGHALLAPTRTASTSARAHPCAAYLSFCRRRGRNGWRWTRPMPRCNPSPRSGPCAPCAATLSRTTSSPSWACIPPDNGTPLAAGSWQAIRPVPMPLPAQRRAWRPVHADLLLHAPPGHHAGPDFMGGYCLLNNAAVAAQWLRDQGAARVAVLDVDYHHGNGTQSIFYDRADVLFVSIHGDPRTEYPFYLGHADETGEGRQGGLQPQSAAGGRQQRAGVVRRAGAGLCAHFRLWRRNLVVSLGLDTFEGDPISRFALASADFLRLGQRLARLGLPTVFVLEGGYAAAELGTNAVNVLEGFEQA